MGAAVSSNGDGLLSRNNFGDREDRQLRKKLRAHGDDGSDINRLSDSSTRLTIGFAVLAFGCLRGLSPKP